MAYNFNSVLERTLSHYAPEDGDYIDLVAFKYIFPTIKSKFWESCLLGCSMNGRSIQVKRIPLLGRLHFAQGKPRVVVLVNSLREWMEHYNPDKDRHIEDIIGDLIKKSRQYEQYLRRLKIESRIKTGPRKDHRPSKAAEAKTLDKLDFSAMRAWG